MIVQHSSRWAGFRDWLFRSGRIGTKACAVRFRPMRIREENRNMFLLTAVTLCCSAVAGTVALFEPAPAPGPAQQVAQRMAIDATAQTPVRVVGAPFEPNVNPRQR